MTPLWQSLSLALHEFLNELSVVAWYANSPNYVITEL